MTYVSVFLLSIRRIGPVGNRALGMRKILLTIYGIGWDGGCVIGKVWPKTLFKIELET